MRATLNGLFLNEEQQFRITFLAVTITPPTINDQTYHIKDTAVTFTANEFTMTALPSTADLPAGITWTYTLKYIDLTTNAPAFVSRTPTGTTPIVVNFSIYSVTNTDYYASTPDGHYKLALVATNSI